MAGQTSSMGSRLQRVLLLKNEPELLCCIRFIFIFSFHIQRQAHLAGHFGVPRFTSANSFYLSFIPRLWAIQDVF